MYLSFFNQYEVHSSVIIILHFILVVQNLIAYLEKKAEQSQELDFEQNEKFKLLTTTKILAYIMSTTLCYIEDQVAEGSNNAENIGKVCFY